MLNRGFIAASGRNQGARFARARNLAGLAVALAFVPFAFAIQPDVQQIVSRSIAATQADWQQLPDFSDIERDADTRGGATTSKTYEVTIIDGTPYSRLVAVDDKALSPAQQAREAEKLRRATEKRAGESRSQRARRLAQYQNGRNRILNLLRAMASAFNFSIQGEGQLEGHDVYIILATPRPGYVPTSRETRVLTGMRGELWIGKGDYKWVKVKAEVVKPVPFGWFLAKVDPGTSFVVEQGAVGQGLWLPERLRVKVNATVLFFPKGYIHEETYRNYHRVSHSSTF